MLTVYRESNNFTSCSSPFEEFCCKMNNEDSEYEEAKFVQRIYDFVQDEKDFVSSSDESTSSSEDTDSDSNPVKSFPDDPQPEKRRRADGSDVEILLDTEVDRSENSHGGNGKSGRFVDSALLFPVANQVVPENHNLPEPERANAQLPESELAEPKPAELKLALPNVPRRKPGPLRRRLRLMCKLNLDNIDVSAVLDKKKLGNCTPFVDKSAGVPRSVDLSEVTDDENYLLDEEEILDMFQAGDIVDASSEDNARLEEPTARRKDTCWPLAEKSDVFSATKKKVVEVPSTKNTSCKEMGQGVTEKVRNLEQSGHSVELEKLRLSVKIVNDSLKQSTCQVSQEKMSHNEWKSQNSLPKTSPQKSCKEERQGLSSKVSDDSDFVSQRTSLKKTEFAKKDANQKNLGPKIRQNILSPEKKASTGVAESDVVKRPKESLFDVEKYVQKPPRSLNRIPLTPEAFLARSQMNSSSRLSGTKKLPPKDAAAAEVDKAVRLVFKETKSQECLSSTNGRPPARPQSRNSMTDENIPGPSPKTAMTSEPHCRVNSGGNRIKNSRNELFSRPVRPERSDNIPSRNTSQGSRMSSPLSDFATRRNIPASQEAAHKMTDDQSERTLAKLGLPNCEEPVCINWNHSNIPSVVNPEGMSGKLDSFVLSESSKSRISPGSSLSRRLSDIQIPSMNLPKDVLSKIDCVLNAD